MIALTRVVLAAVFLFALWIDPERQPSEELPGYAILGAYLAAAVALLVLSWRSWWWDHRLARLTMLGDVATFLAAILLTEGAGTDFTSPFLAFFAFLMLAATIRWDWRVTIVIGLTVTTLYLLVGLYMGSVEPGFATYRFGRRISYMLVLALILAWFGLQRREQSIERFTESHESPANVGELVTQVLGYAIAQSNAARAALAWADHEEPDVRVAAVGFDPRVQRLGPEEFDPDQGFVRDACLFDTRHRRSLVARRNKRPTAKVGPAGDAFSSLCGLNEGLALPLTGLTGRGELVLADIRGLSADHLALGVLLAREITAAFDRQATLTLAHESALAKVRDSLARDLHDSVAQSLAGTALRLEGLRACIRTGRDPEAEIDSIKQSLREEQRHVRGLITRLRRGDQAVEMVEVAAAIRPLVSALSVQWGITSSLRVAEADMTVSALLAHEIGQILREAVANAVRHGQASKVDLTFERHDEALRVTIADDGCGFPGGEAGPGPWSIGGRIDKLNGRLDVSTGVAGTRLEIVVPIGSVA